MVGIVRRETPSNGQSGPPTGRDLYAVGAGEPFGGSRMVHAEERTDYRSFGPAGDLSGFRSLSAAEVPQIVAYRVLREPVAPAITPMVTLDPDSSETSDCPAAQEIGRQYEEQLATVLGIAVQRKKTGTHYTPATLVEALLDSTLDPLLDEASDLPTRQERAQALLQLTYCDPANGAAAFLVAAARRVGARLAVELSGQHEPDPALVREATWTAVTTCTYGVDLSATAGELAKLVLWLECLEPDFPVPYLNHKIKHGNGLLGAEPQLLQAGIPDGAYAAIVGDDPKVATLLRRRNAGEKAPQQDLFGDLPTIDVSNTRLSEVSGWIAGPTEPTLYAVRVQAAVDRALEPERQRLRLIADTWCAAFVQPKTEAARASWITQRTVERIAAGEDGPDLKPVKDLVAKLAAEYGFFHWWIEFPHIFRIGKEAA